MLFEKSRFEGGDADLHDLHDGIDLIACGVQPADVWRGLTKAVGLLLDVLDECCPGACFDEWLIGGGLDPTTSNDPPPCVRRSDVDAASARGELRMTFGGKVHDIAEDLLGESMRRAAEAGPAALRQAAVAEHDSVGPHSLHTSRPA